MRAFRSGIIVPILAVLMVTGTAALAATIVFHEVHPGLFDPGKTFLVQAKWLDGIGCPGPGARTFDGSNFTSYTDPACNPAPADAHNAGLLLAKTGPTANYAESFAQLKDVAGTTATELGYDIRKQASVDDPRGSHCGFGAPRFTVTTTDGFWSIGCNSPPADTVTVGNGWLRLRWGTTGPLMGFENGTQNLTQVTGAVQSIYIEFDEGQDASGGPDSFGLAVLDNVDYNGKMVGKG